MSTEGETTASASRSLATLAALEDDLAHDFFDLTVTRE